MKKIILASKSPRRREILEMLQWNFEVAYQEMEERFEENLSLEENMQKIALKKAKAMEEKYQDQLILACDTMVVLDGESFGKPKEEEDAKRMLRLLSGKQSHVYSAVALVHKALGKEETFVEKTKIYFHPLSEEEIAQYVATGEAMDKAGGYAVQGVGSIFIEKIEGDYWNVVGLPISRVYQALKRWSWL